MKNDGEHAVTDISNGDELEREKKYASHEYASA